MFLGVCTSDVMGYGFRFDGIVEILGEDGGVGKVGGGEYGGERRGRVGE